MTKTKTVKKSPAEIKAEQDLKDEKKKDELCAAELEVVLKKYDRAFQPFLFVSEFGIGPRVRLAPIPDEKE